MSYKKNFKWLIIGHLIGMVAMVILILVVGNDTSNILMGLLGGLVISLVLQVVLYLIKPPLFNSKVSKHPHRG